MVMPPKRVALVKDAMTAFPHFIEVHEDSVAARRIMLEYGIRHLPVKDDGKLIGVVTERDLEVAELVGKSQEPARAIPVRELCSLELYVVELHARMDVVLTEMARRKVGSALVVKDGRLAGILTTSDVCRLYGELLRELSPPADEPA